MDSKETLKSAEATNTTTNNNIETDDPPPTYTTATATATSTPSLSPNPTPTPIPRFHPLPLPALNKLRQKRVILASTSPRRRQILSLLSLPNLAVIPSNAPEDFPKSLAPFEYVLATASRKAQSVYEAVVSRAGAGAGTEAQAEEEEEPGLILAADTVVVDSTSGAILEKPRSEGQHFAMLRALRDNREHRVYTGVAVMAPLASAREPGYAMRTSVEETVVRFDGEVTDELIWGYVRTREGVDKAGGYGVQGLGSILVERIEGSFDNVVGLPLKTTLKLIETVLDKADDEDSFGMDEEDEGDVED